MHLIKIFPASKHQDKDWDLKLVSIRNHFIRLIIKLGLKDHFDINQFRRVDDNTDANALSW